MAIGKRRKQQQSALWVAASELPKSPGHPLYRRLNVLLEKAKFDEYAEKRCERYYAGDVGRPGLRSGRCFRLLLVGYFEGLDSERGIAWRPAADSLGVRSFLEVGVNERGPHHSTISRPRRLIDVETHRILQPRVEVGGREGRCVWRQLFCAVRCASFTPGNPTRTRLTRTSMARSVTSA